MLPYTLHHLWGCLLRNWRTAAVVWLMVVGGGVAMAVVAKNNYRSEGKLLVRLGRENVTLDPTANLGQGSTTAVPLTREMEMNTIAETLRSQTLIEKVVARLTPEAILNDQRRWRDAILPSSLPEEEAAMLKLARMINVEVLRKSNVVSISCQAHDQELAKEAATVVLDEYLNYHRELHRNVGARSFFEQQAQRLQEELREAEAQLLALKDQHEVSTIAEQKKLLISQIGDLQADIQTAEAELRETNAAIATYERQLKTLPQRLLKEATSGHPNMAADTMRDQLYTLQIRESELAALYTEDHPLLKQVREQVVKSQATLERETQSRVQSTEARSEAYQQAELGLLAKQAVAASLEARIAARRPQAGALQEKLLALGQVEVELERLEREIELRRTSYMQYAQSLEQTRIDESLEAARISNISVAQWPAVSHRPVSPDRPVIVAVAMVLATFVSAGTALARDQLRGFSLWPPASASQPLASNPAVVGT